MLKRKDFVPDDIRTDRIQHIEMLVSKADDGSTQVLDIWREGDGKQELKLYLQRLVPIMEDLIADEQFASHQYLSFKRREHDGSRVFGPANGSLWWQINEERVGPNRVLLGLVMFIDESYNKKSMSCEAMYGERHTVENFNDHGSLLMIALRSAALLNIDESKRFKKGAYRFWGCIPKYDNEAAKAEGKSDEWIRRRSAEIHRAAMHPVVEQIREFCDARPYLLDDGVTRLP